MDRFGASLGIVAAGLTFGYLIQRVARSRTGRDDVTLERPRRILQIIALIVLNPLAALSAIWTLALEDIGIAFMPLMGILTIFVGGSAGLILARAQKLARPQAGAYFSASGSFNIGLVGGLIVFLSYGESGYALVPIFRIFEEILYYAVLFPIARSFGPERSIEGPVDRGIRRILRVFADPFVIVTLTAIALGFALNLTGVPRPDIFSPVVSVAILAGSLFMLTSIGMALRLGRIRAYLRPAFLVAATKFAIVPAVVIPAAIALGFGEILGGLPLRVIIILSSVPCAFLANVPPTLYKLDVDLANTAIIVTMAFLVVVVPLQILVIGWVA